MPTNNMSPLEEAKARLDLIINKARIDLYKPIQIAEVLYQSRMGTSSIDVSNLETYRRKSIRWRNEVCMKFLGKISTSSARYQDNVWEANAMTSEFLSRLDVENKKTGGAVEKYIYLRFQEKQQTIASIITIIESADPRIFEITSLFTIFQTNKAIRRSINKVYEIVVYSLIVDQIESDNIIVVCRTADKQVIEAVINQISWGRRVRGIVTETNLAEWYTRCLRGTYADTLASGLLNRLSVEFKKEFPQAAEIVNFLEERNYLAVPSPDLWQIDLVGNLQ